jgi:hypothetical protein
MNVDGPRWTAVGLMMSWVSRIKEYPMLTGSLRFGRVLPSDLRRVEVSQSWNV